MESVRRGEGVSFPLVYLFLNSGWTSPEGLRRTTNEAICGEFRQYFLKLFTREPGLSSAQFDTYLADFPRLSATEAAGCEGRIKEEEIRDALKSVGLDNTL